MLYAWIKILHIISASVLFGTGLGTAFYMFYVNQQKNITLIAKATSAVVVADWLFTATSGVMQASTGYILIYLKGYSLTSFWILGSILGYIIAVVCWAPVVWLQMRCRDLALAASINQTPLPKEYQHYFRIWWILGIPAFIALIGVFYLMANKPEHWFL
ncbi:DUF2269 domain-containing protein [Rickettsiella endosymbiont of Miltochrista miniata]|uniref:DUF2269 family protein n=1 Tax=Rickettsiella endosymbiont of Miltochrista miniata TaxID=3066239 RepID=UPI00313EF14B